jgi:hypothetical protein
VASRKTPSSPRAPPPAVARGAFPAALVATFSVALPLAVLDTAPRGAAGSGGEALAAGARVDARRFDALLGGARLGLAEAGDFGSLPALA